MKPEKLFPYTPRKGQLKAIKSIFRSFKRRRYIFFQAPTGFGKTPVVISALYPYIMSGMRILWAVRTGNETDRPIEELKVFKEYNDVEVFGFSFRGKRDMCLLLKDMRIEGASYDDASFICRHMRDKCRYYRRYSSGDYSLSYIVERPRLYSEILRICTAMEICPYYLQYTLLRYASLVSFSYNYVLNEKISWAIRRIVDFGNSILVVDEAHNLQNVNLNSDRITSGTVRRAINEAREFSWRELVNVLEEVEQRMDNIAKYILREGEEDIEFHPEEFFDILKPDVLELMLEGGNYIRRLKLREGKRPASSLHHFARFWLNAYRCLEKRGYAFIASLEKNILVMEIWDMRAGEVLGGIWPNFKRTLFMSGTLEPVDAFAEIIGVSSYVKLVIPSEYRRENVLAIVTQGLTTRGEELSSDMALKYVEAIGLFVENIDSNVAIFSASYRIQNTLIKYGLLAMLKKAGRRIFVEEKGLSGDEARKMLEEFKACSESSTKAVLIAPAGGRFAEGADFPGKELEGIFIVGIPYDRVTARTRKYIEYYSEVYGREKGRFLSYILPAFRKASQAMGRALRSSDDIAVIVAGDIRYKDYLDLLPDYFRSNAFMMDYRRMGDVIGSWFESRRNGGSCREK